MCEEGERKATERGLGICLVLFETWLLLSDSGCMLLTLSLVRKKLKCRECWCERRRSGTERKKRRFSRVQSLACEAVPVDWVFHVTNLNSF